MGHRLRKRISSVLLKAAVVSSICFGLLPFYYSKQQQRFVTSKLLNIYNICINLLFAVLMAFLLPIFSTFNDAFQSGDPLAELLNRLTVYISFCGILPTTWWINWTGRQRLQQLFNDFANIEIDYFYRYKHFTVECATFDYYVMWKVFATFLQNLSFFYSSMEAGNRGSLFIAFMCLMALLTNVILLVSTHFFLAVLFTYRFIWVLNRRLECMTSSDLTPRQQRILSTEIDSYICTRLIGLCERYTRIHQCQLLLVIGAMTICNIEVLFYVRLLWSGKVSELNTLNVLAILQIFVVNVLDFWLTIIICELALVTSRKTLEILRSFSAKPRLLTHLERSNVLPSIATVKSCVFICAAYLTLTYLTLTSGLKVLLTMILYLIYLVQYYHENL